VPNHIKELDNTKLLEIWDRSCYNMHFIWWKNMSC